MVHGSLPAPIIAELLRLELAIARHDEAQVPESLAGLLHPEFFEFGSSGRIWRVHETIAGFARPNTDTITIDEFDVHPLADGAVLATYRMTETPIQGEPRHRNRSSLWVRQGERWLMRFHQGTPTAPRRPDVA